MVILRSAAAVVGLGEGFVLGDEGVTEGSRLGAKVGLRVGGTVGDEGAMDGDLLGMIVDIAVGDIVGSIDWTILGLRVGTTEEGFRVGAVDGPLLGLTEGLRDGALVNVLGANVGDELGA